MRTPASASFLSPPERARVRQRQEAEERRARLACPEGGRWHGAPSALSLRTSPEQRRARLACPAGGRWHGAPLTLSSISLTVQPVMPMRHGFGIVTAAFGAVSMSRPSVTETEAAASGDSPRVEQDAEPCI